MSQGRPPSRAARAANLGFSLVELLVAMAIGLVLSLAVSRVLIGGQQARLSTTSTNDTNQTGAYVSYLLDRVVRSAGSGFAQRRNNYGCILNASRSGTAVLPSPAAFNPPFASVPKTLRLAPVLIFEGASEAGSDVLAVMTGSAGYGEAAQQLKSGLVTTSQFQLDNTLGMQANDLVLLVDGDKDECMIQQVSSGFTEVGDQAVGLGGTYHDATGTLINLTAMGVGDAGYAMAIGRPGNWPEFRLYGVGANNTLFSFDLLRTTGSEVPDPVAEGVVAMRALYGVDTSLSPDGTVDEWKDPGSGDFRSSKLLDGSATARKNLSNILAIKVALLLRTNLPEKVAVAESSYTLFADLDPPLPTPITVSGTDPLFRHRLVEVTIPLRNLLMP